MVDEATREDIYKKLLALEEILEEMNKKLNVLYEIKDELRTLNGVCEEETKDEE
jgi:hypothetical protein